MLEDITSISDLTKEDILALLAASEKMKNGIPKNLLSGKIIASCFFEPSTRTRLSFESAAYKLGAQVIGFSEAECTSFKKGESLADSIKVISSYADAIVLRHPLEGAARLAAQISSVPVINAGDGSNQHPTQTLLDLFTILECQGTLDSLSIAFAGDLLYGRTVHSLAPACALFNMRMYFVSPSSLTMPDEICEHLRRLRTKFSFHKTIEEIMPKIDILYVTRLQKERVNTSLHQQMKNPYTVSKELLRTAKPNARILHPLPRLEEIAKDIDELPHAYYFQQAANGLYVRAALLAKLLSVEL